MSELLKNIDFTSMDRNELLEFQKEIIDANKYINETIMNKYVNKYYKLDRSYDLEIGFIYDKLNIDTYNVKYFILKDYYNYNDEIHLNNLKLNYGNLEYYEIDKNVEIIDKNEFENILNNQFNICKNKLFKKLNLINVEKK